VLVSIVIDVPLMVAVAVLIETEDPLVFAVGVVHTLYLPQELLELAVVAVGLGLVLPPEVPVLVFPQATRMIARINPSTTQIERLIISNANASSGCI